MSERASSPSVRVHVGSILHGYTNGASALACRGACVRDVLDELERRYPGLRFRIIDEQDRVRPHIKIYAAGALVRELSAPLRDGDELHVLQALSGG